MIGKTICMLASACLLVACSSVNQERVSRVGVALYSFNRFSLEDALQKAQEAGVHYVEGFSFHKIGGAFSDKQLATLNESEISTVRSMLQANKLTMVSMYASAKTISEWERQLYIGQQLGLEFLVGEPTPDIWDDLDDLAAQYQLKVAIHQHAESRSHFWHPDSVLVALEGHPNFVVCGDLGHWTRSGLDPVECLQKLEGHLVSIHAKDLDSFGNLDATDVKVGDGIIDYERVFSELDRQKFNGFIFVECEHDWEDNFNDVEAAVGLITKATETQ